MVVAIFSDSLAVSFDGFDLILVVVGIGEGAGEAAVRLESSFGEHVALGVVGEA